MSILRKNNEILAEIYRYLNNEMSNSERYEFDRLLERDPFLAEALEGLSDSRITDVEKDLNEIDLLAGKKRVKLSAKLYLTIVAGLLLIVVIVVLFTRPEKSKLVKTPKINIQTPVNSDSFLFTAKVDSVNRDTTSFLIDEASPQVLSDKIGGTTNELHLRVQAEKNTESLVPKKQAVTQNPTTEKVVKAPKNLTSIQVEDLKVSNDLQETPKVNKEKNAQADVPEKPSTLADHVNSNQDATILPTTIEAASNEPNIRKGLNAEASPMGGFDLFNAYVEKNLRYPISEENAQREVVRIKFDISVTGEPTNFVVIKGPENDDFSSEAIRLIKAGPKWSPAVKDGLPVEAEVSQRIVFKAKK